MKYRGGLFVRILKPLPGHQDLPVLPVLGIQEMHVPRGHHGLAERFPSFTMVRLYSRRASSSAAIPLRIKKRLFATGWISR